MALPLILALLTPPDVSLADLGRFPPADVAEVRYEFAHRHLEYLLKWRESVLEESKYAPFASVREGLWADANYLTGWYEEASAYRDAWYYLRTARDGGYGVTYRAECLRNLRKTVGWWAYCRGAMPAAAPVQRFYWRE